MKKLLLCAFCTLLLAGCTANIDKEGNINLNNDIELTTLFSSKSENKNKAWVGTFQLASNDMKNNIIKKAG